VALAPWQGSAFTIPQTQRVPLRVLSSSPKLAATGDSSGEFEYKPQYEKPTKRKKPALYPNAGDIVRYYDLDGGKVDGEVMVGKIAYIQKVLGSSPESSWAVEITQLEDVGDGFFGEYSSRQRNSKKTMRSLEEVSPISASFVRSENAFKIPRDASGVPLVRALKYDIDSYEGPFSGENKINQDVLDEDWKIYSTLKNKLLREAVLVSIVGTLVASIAKGPEDAIIYALGAISGVAYLFLLSVKTDTVGSAEAKMGSNISNIRFGIPLFVFITVAVYNKSLGADNPAMGSNMLSTVTSEQFAAIVIGFLTYRIPLFGNQIADLLKDGDILITGSAGMAMQLAKQDVEEQPTIDSSEGLKTVLLVSGPLAAGRSELVQRLISESEGKLVPPRAMDRVEDGAKFELVESRNELLIVDSSGRYGVTKEGILNGAPSGSVVVVDADVATVKRLQKVPGARLIGVWVGLDATEKFESRLQTQLETGELVVPEDEDKTSFLRAKIKEIVKDIEYGIVSGVFEFTILNDDVEDSMQQLREAAEYCFK
jgi:guanylate kinase